MLLLKCIGIGMLFMIGLVIIITIATFLLGLLENILIKIEELENKTLKDVLIMSLLFVMISVTFGFIIMFFCQTS